MVRYSFYYIQAPGDLIKPKSENVKRGRPKTVTQPTGTNSLNGESLGEQNTDSLFAEKINSILSTQQPFEPVPEFQPSEDPERNCNRIFAQYFKIMENLEVNRKEIVGGFLWLLKKSLEDHYGYGYCQQSDASQIVQMANLIVDEKRIEYIEEFAIPRELMITLTKVFFDWLYAQGYTDHYLKQEK